MNKQERDEMLAVVNMLLDKAYDLLEQISDEEQEALDNVPESLQGTNRYDEMSDRNDAIQEQFSNLEDLKDELSEYGADTSKLSIVIKKYNGRTKKSEEINY